MRHRTRLIILGLAALPLVGCGANSPATPAAAPVVYAVNTKSTEISQYRASQSDSGALRPLVPATVPTGPFPYGIAIDPQGNSAYVADVNAGEEQHDLAIPHQHENRRAQLEASVDRAHRTAP
ncbi:MAG: hypothetical protein LBV34_08370 [Nocardiopsaceae bacterium]|jgi:DNA-binding beta-propeller fold protein YncE|nr:hypothetical protein [Nocardiopsaceae bacterium]